MLGKVRYFRLQQVLRLRKQKAKQVEQQLGHLNKERLHRQAEIRKLARQLAEMDLPGAAEAEPSQTALWNAESRYASFLQQRIELQQAQLANANEKFAKARQEFLKCHAEWKAVERLRENHELAEEQKLQRQSQLNMDDFVLASRHPSDHTKK